MSKREIVIWGAFGGYYLSAEVIYKYAELKGIKLYPDYRTFSIHWTVPHESRQGRKIRDVSLHQNDIARDDPFLIEAIKALGHSENRDTEDFKIVRIPSDVDWVVLDYDGWEWIAEKHRTWP